MQITELFSRARVSIFCSLQLFSPFSTLPNYEESIGQSRSDNGVITGKTAEKQDKCSLELSREHIPALHPLRPNGVHYGQTGRTVCPIKRP